ncbi:MAG: endolytic transglycosylase MltG [Phycisphaerales bacterium]
MGRSLASNALTLMVVVLLAVASFLAWAQTSYRTAGPLREAICLQVPPGSSMNSVSRNLAEQGAIQSASLFRLGADYSKKSQQLKAGSFLVNAGASMDEIIATITASGRSTCGTEVNYRISVNKAEKIVRELNPQTQRYVEVARFAPGDPEPAPYTPALREPGTRLRVTLSEGVTSWQVVDSLSKLDFLEGDVEETPAEGSLSPDSYEIRQGTDRNRLIATMQAQQAEILAEAWQARAPGLPLASAEEALILASIVEKETGVAQERPQVASVFINRLNRGMRLQTDPTVIYGITKGEGGLGRGLRASELRARTAWNTYVIQGLPPTPIANPGRASIEATLDPDGTDYLFFVADGTGGHAFAETLQQHNRNVARWREIEAELRARQADN